MPDLIVSEEIDDVAYAAHRLADDVCTLHELHAAGKGHELQAEFSDLYQTYVRFGDFLAYLRNTYHAEAAQ